MEDVLTVIIKEYGVSALGYLLFLGHLVWTERKRAYDDSLRRDHATQQLAAYRENTEVITRLMVIIEERLPRP